MELQAESVRSLPLVQVQVRPYWQPLRVLSRIPELVAPVFPFLPFYCGQICGKLAVELLPVLATLASVPV